MDQSHFLQARGTIKAEQSPVCTDPTQELLVLEGYKHET